MTPLSLTPIRCFSKAYAWIKADFLRSWYSKRARFRVRFVATYDEHAVWPASDPVGHGDLLLRDVLANLDEREQRIIIAITQGRTVSEVAAEDGLKGHSGISKRLAVIRRRFRRLFDLGPEPDDAEPGEGGREGRRS